MDNRFAVNEQLPTGSSRRAAAVVPSDTVDLAFVPRYLWVGTGGNVSVITAAGDTVTFAAVPSGYRLEISVTRVLAGGTTANMIVALE